MKILRDMPFGHSTINLPRLTRHNVANPSFVVQANALRVVYRGCNYSLRKSGYQYFYGSSSSRVTDTQNYIADLTLDLKLSKVDFLEDRQIRARSEALDGIQDLKLFAWQNRIFAVGSGCNSVSFLKKLAPYRTFKMMLFEIKGRHLDWLTTFPSFDVQEKNWMPWVKDQALFLLHRPNPFKLLRFDRDSKSLVECKSAVYDCIEDGSSGSGSIIPHGDHFLGMTHKKRGVGASISYTHRLIVLDQDMTIVRASEPFSFENEPIEYGSGLGISGSDIYLGYGVFDERATIVRTDLFKLMNWLTWQECRSATAQPAAQTSQ